MESAASFEILGAQYRGDTVAIDSNNLNFTLTFVAVARTEQTQTETVKLVAYLFETET